MPAPALTLTPRPLTFALRPSPFTPHTDAEHTVVSKHVERLLNAARSACKASDAMFVSDRNWSPQRPVNVPAECLDQATQFIHRLTLCEPTDFANNRFAWTS